jgi:hypothetical protein
MVYFAGAHDIIAKGLGFHYCSSAKFIDPKGKKSLTRGKHNQIQLDMYKPT